MYLFLFLIAYFYVTCSSTLEVMGVCLALYVTVGISIKVQMFVTGSMFYFLPAKKRFFLNQHIFLSHYTVSASPPSISEPV